MKRLVVWAQTSKRALRPPTTPASPPRRRMVWGVPGWVAQESAPCGARFPVRMGCWLRIGERTCTPPNPAEASAIKAPVL